MVSPIPRPQPPQPRSTKTGATKTGATKPASSSSPQVQAQPESITLQQSQTQPQPQPQAGSTKLSGKPSLYARYRALSLRVKLYIWITTAGAAWLADSLSDRIFEQNMIDAEANRRVEMEIRKMRELEVLERNSASSNQK